jgi:hypothetical protein
LTVVHHPSYVYRICMPDDGSHEPKHVAFAHYYPNKIK